MTADEYQLVARFLARRKSMDTEPRHDLGIEIYERVLKHPFRAGDDGADPEGMLEKVETFYKERTRIL
jgi:hypothetical protein